MPTLFRSEGFEFQVVSALAFGGVNGAGIFDAVNRPAGVTIETVDPITGAASLKIVEDGLAITNAQIGFAGTQVLVGSFYIRMDANPSVQSRIIRAPGPANSCKFIVETDGKINTNIQFDGTAGPVVTDGVKHRIDFRFLTNATTYTIDWSVDGVAQTQHTLAGQAATNMTDLEIGSNNASHTATFWIDDLVLSATSGDHPIGGHKVFKQSPTGDGTHVISGAGDFDKSDGTDILSTTTDAWTEIDAIPPNTGDYIQDTAGASTAYTEHTFEDTAESTIWHAEGQAAMFSSNTTLCKLTVRIVDSGGTTVADIYTDADVSETALHYRRISLVANPSAATLNGYKVRIGLSTDVAPDPRCAGVIIQYSVPFTGLFTQSLSATSAFTVGFQKLLLKVLSVVPTFSSVLTGFKVFFKSLDVGSTFVVSLAERATFLKTLTGTSAFSAVLAIRALYLKAFAVVSTFGVSMSRFVFKSLAVSSSFAASVVKKMSVTFSVSSVFSAAQSAQAIFKRALSTTSSFVAGLTTVFIPAGEPPPPGIGRIVSKMRSWLQHPKDHP